MRELTWSVHNIQQRRFSLFIIAKYVVEKRAVDDNIRCCRGLLYILPRGVRLRIRLPQVQSKVATLIWQVTP